MAAANAPVAEVAQDQLTSDVAEGALVSDDFLLWTGLPGKLLKGVRIPCELLTLAWFIPSSSYPGTLQKRFSLWRSKHLGALLQPHRHTGSNALRTPCRQRCLIGHVSLADRLGQVVHLSLEVR